MPGPHVPPPVTVTVAVCVIAVPFAVADTVFDSATVELKLPVATPLASAAAAGWVTVLPLPVAASTTVAPVTGFPKSSLAVTVIVDDPLPAAIEVGEAVTLDCEAETGPAFTVTEAVCVMAVPLAVAETVLVPVTVELSVPVATPLELVVLLGCGRVLPLPVAASAPVAPLIALPLASFAVTVIVDVPLPATIGDVALTVERAASTGPGAPTAALISTPSAPPFRAVHVAATAPRFVAHSASRSPGVLSPDGCSAISVKP